MEKSPFVCSMRRMVAGQGRLVPQTSGELFSFSHFQILVVVHVVEQVLVVVIAVVAIVVVAISVGRAVAVASSWCASVRRYPPTLGKTPAPGRGKKPRVHTHHSVTHPSIISCGSRTGDERAMRLQTTGGRSLFVEKRVFAVLRQFSSQSPCLRGANLLRT